MTKEVLRIIDANFNRSREGLRVCEDVARFVLNAPRLTKELKSVRHDISSILKDSVIKSGKLFESRDSEGDVGRRPKHKSEMARSNPTDIFEANIERVKESIRVLEEFTKLIDERVSARFSDLRYRVYGIEKRALNDIIRLRQVW